MKTKETNKILILVFVFILSILITGCTNEQIKYQCADGSIVENLDLCPKTTIDEDDYDVAQKMNEINKYKNSTSESNSNKSIKEMLENTTIRKIVGDYNENEIKAEIKYDQKTMYIIGKIREIGTDLSNNPYLILFGQSDWDNAKFIFSDKNDLITLNQYDIIKVKCKIIGSSLKTLSMNDCELMEIVEKNSNLKQNLISDNSIINAHSIIEDYHTNPFYGDNKYNNKDFLIQGEIKSIKKTSSGEPAIILKSGNYYWAGLNCIIRQEKERILLFDAGDIILVSGIIKGQSGNSIIIEDCIIDEEWSNKKSGRSTSNDLIGNIKLVGYLEEQKVLPYTNEDEWNKYCEDWAIREKCDDVNDWMKCSDLFNCHEIKIINNDFIDWHNVEVLINDKYIVLFDPYNRVAPKLKFQPNQPILESKSSLEFGSKMITCLLLDENSKENVCDDSKNKINIENGMVNFERYNGKLCNCESFTFAQENEPIRNISVTANEGSFVKYFN